MKKTLALGALLASVLAAQAAEPDAISNDKPTPVKLPRGRCPTMPAPEMPMLRDGDYRLTANFLLKADGKIENLRFQGKAPLSLFRAVETAIKGYRCLPADADQEIESEFRVKIS